MINIGILGFGTVGRGVYEIFSERKEEIEKTIGDDFNINKILVRDLQSRSDFKEKNILTTEIDSIIEDSEINLVIEVTNAVDEMYPSLVRAMKLGKNIITANKALVSKYFENLMEISKENNVKFLFDSSVGGTIPVLEAVKNIAVGNEVESVKGVLNGTCNFILSKMEEGLSYEESLKIAQEIGFAEADPTADVGGYDTMRKLRILATLAFNESVREEDIELEGITNIKIEDVKKASENGERYKLLAQASVIDGQILASVSPQLVKKDSIFGGLVGGENVIIINGNNCGEVTFKGLGAGSRPTAYSIIGDFLNIYK